MSLTILAAFLAVTAAEPDPSLEVPRSSFARVRPLTPGGAELLLEARRRSTIVASLVRRFETTDAVVYVTDALPTVRNGPKSNLVFLSLDTTVRYLRIWLDGSRLSPSERIAALGHELFHALEVATAPEVRDARSFTQLYRRIGWESTKDRFETQGARDMSARIRKYLDRGDVDTAELILPQGVKGSTSPGPS
jgi:hypothetical protein